VGGDLQVFVQAYNTDKIKKEDLPKTWQDLLDPKWKGRLGVESADGDWFAALLQELGHEKGMKLFKDIVDTNGISVRKGHSLLASLIVSGEVPLGLTIYSYSTPGMKLKGAPIESFVISPAIAQFSAIGMFRKAPHPYAAMLFYDFMLSEEGQKIFVDRTRVPASTKIDTRWKSVPIKFIDPVLSLDMNEKWSKDYETAITKRVKK
jgi:iron(III) transport system substrate-binding protein